MELNKLILELKEQFSKQKAEAEKTKKELESNLSKLYDVLKLREEDLYRIEDDDEVDIDTYHKASDKADEANHMYYICENQVDLLDDIAYKLDHMIDDIDELINEWKDK